MSFVLGHGPLYMSWALVNNTSVGPWSSIHKLGLDLQLQSSLDCAKYTQHIVFCEVKDCQYILCQQSPPLAFLNKTHLDYHKLVLSTSKQPE